MFMQKERELIIEYSLRMLKDGLTVGTSGNVPAWDGLAMNRWPQLTLTRRETPRIHYMLALLGGPVRVAAYAQFGTEELARNCIVAMKDRYGVLLQNHGATTYGETLAKANSRSMYLEWLCRIYCEAKTLGEPRLLTAVEFDAAARAVSTYGQSASKG